ncbi:hypothetical protein ACP4OV_012139 [Aristida adscensionis]
MASAEPHPAQEEPPAAAGQEKAPQEQAPEAAAPGAEAEEEEEEEGECGFCLYMKGGGCRDAFVAWEECVEAAQKESTDMVERCAEATSNLMRCMQAHPDYYGPVLNAEQAVSDQAEAAAAAAAAATGKDKGAEPPSGEEEEEKKEGAVPHQADSSTPAAGEGKKE